jgi:hypothetical protein
MAIANIIFPVLKKNNFVITPWGENCSSEFQEIAAIHYCATFLLRWRFYVKNVIKNKTICNNNICGCDFKAHTSITIKKGNRSSLSLLVYLERFLIPIDRNSE